MIVPPDFDDEDDDEDAEDDDDPLALDDEFDELPQAASTSADATARTAVHAALL
ncbi:MAG TPA: hypothetical protein VGF93_17220 [Solirubrobacteraceae bacterium]